VSLPLTGPRPVPHHISAQQACARGLESVEARARARAQLGKDLAAQRKQLRLFRHPLRTLYYFGACAGGAAASGALWLARHRLTLYLLVPALLAYAGLKATGAWGPRRASLLSGAACTAAVLRAVCSAAACPPGSVSPLMTNMCCVCWSPCRPRSADGAALSWDALWPCASTGCMSGDDAGACLWLPGQSAMWRLPGRTAQ